MRWRRAGESFERSTPDAVGFVRDLLASAPNGEITDLDVRRATLEDTYLAMVQRHESGDRSEAANAFGARGDGDGS